MTWVSGLGEIPSADRTMRRRDRWAAEPQCGPDRFIWTSAFEGAWNWHQSEGRSRSLVPKGTSRDSLELLSRGCCYRVSDSRIGSRLGVRVLRCGPPVWRQVLEVPCLPGRQVAAGKASDSAAVLAGCVSGVVDSCAAGDGDFCSAWWRWWS